MTFPMSPLSPSATKVQIDEQEQVFWMVDKAVLDYLFDYKKNEKSVSKFQNSAMLNCYI